MIKTVMNVSSGTTDGVTRKLKVTKLIEGHDYNFKVYAINEIGESDPCASTEPIKARLPFGMFSYILHLRVDKLSYSN